MKWRRQAFAALLTAAMQQGCLSDSDTPTAATGDGFEVRLVRTVYQTTADAGRFLVVSEPVGNIPVVVVWRDQTQAVSTDAAGRAVFPKFNPSFTSPADLAIAGDGGRPDFSVFGWPLTQVTLPLPTATPPAAVAATNVTDQFGFVAGLVTGWTVSGLGEGSEAHFAWRHTNGDVLGVVGQVNDLYARNGVDVGSGTVECVCNDAGTQMCLAAAQTQAEAAACSCPDGAIICNDPGGFAVGVSAVSFFVPPGTIELGFAERVTRFAGGVFRETGGLFYDPGFAVPAGAVFDRQTFAAQVLSDPELCPGGSVSGAMLLFLEGLRRTYVLAGIGGVDISLFLVSPLGLRIDILRRDRWPQTDVFSLAEARQRIAVRYPYALARDFAGFSYGYDVAATSHSSVGGVRYDFLVRRVVPQGIVDPCRIDIDMRTFETVFARPTTLEPLFTDAEQTVQWSGPAAPLRRLLIRDSAQRIVTEAWMFDANRSLLQVGSGATASWTWAPGEYRFDYAVIEPPYQELPPNALVRADVRLFAEAGSFFEQIHRFTVIE